MEEFSAYYIWFLCLSLYLLSVFTLVLVKGNSLRRGALAPLYSTSPSQTNGEQGIMVTQFERGFTLKG